VDDHFVKIQGHINSRIFSKPQHCISIKTRQPNYLRINSLCYFSNPVFKLNPSILEVWYAKMSWKTNKCFSIQRFFHFYTTTNQTERASDRIFTIHLKFKEPFSIQSDKEHMGWFEMPFTLEWNAFLKVSQNANDKKNRESINQCSQIGILTNFLINAEYLLNPLLYQWFQTYLMEHFNHPWIVQWQAKLHPVKRVKCNNSTKNVNASPLYNPYYMGKKRFWMSKKGRHNHTYFYLL